MSGGVTCARCLGRFSEADFAVKRRLSEKLGKPFEPPKICLECVLALVMVDDVHGNEDLATVEVPR